MISQLQGLLRVPVTEGISHLSHALHWGPYYSKHLFLCLLLFIVLTTPSTPFLVFRGGRTGPADPTTAGPMRDSIADPLLTCEKPAYHLYRSMLTRTYSLDVKESCGDLRMSRS